MSVVIKIVPSANPEILAHEIRKRFTDAKVGFVDKQGISITASSDRENEIAKYARFPGHVRSISLNGVERIVTRPYKPRSAAQALVA